MESFHEKHIHNVVLLYKSYEEYLLKIPFSFHSCFQVINKVLSGVRLIQANSNYNKLTISYQQTT